MTRTQLMNFCMTLSLSSAGVAPRAGPGAKRVRAASVLRKGAGLAGGLLAACAGNALEPLLVGPQGPDGARIERSGRHELGPGLRPDTGGTGALVIAADGLTVELAGELRGAAAD